MGDHRSCGVLDLEIRRPDWVQGKFRGEQGVEGHLYGLVVQVFIILILQADDAGPGVVVREKQREGRAVEGD